MWSQAHLENQNIFSRLKKIIIIIMAWDQHALSTSETKSYFELFHIAYLHNMRQKTRTSLFSKFLKLSYLK